jgi:hypothetical protein
MKCLTRDFQIHLPGFEPSGDTVRDLVQRLPLFTFDCTLPYGQHVPALLLQPSHCLPIYGTIAIDLFSPEFLSGLGPLEEVAFMTVPKATMNKHNGIVCGEYEIWFSGESLVVEAVAEPPGEQGFSDQKLGFCVLTADPAHHPGSRCLVDHISHSHILPGFPPLSWYPVFLLESDVDDPKNPNY